MRCFGKKEERSRERHEKRHHSEPQSSEYWTKMNGNGEDKNIGGKRTKKRRKSNSENRRRMSLGGNTKMTNGNEMAQGNGGSIGQEWAEGGGGGQLEFTKITERIFALIFPSGNSDSIYRQNIKSISERIKRTFPDRYKIFNLSQKRSDLGRANQQGAVLEFGWPDTLAPPLDRLCSICKQLENHLNNSPENVAIIHCKGGIYRAGIVVAAFMNYTSICSGEKNLPDRFSMKLFTEKYLGPDAQPSHKRYVKYFANLLSGTTKVYPSPIFLNQILLNKLFPNKIVKLKLYERMKPIWSSGKITLKEHAFVDLSTNRLSLRGDVLLKCYEPSKEGTEKNLLFQCQFNTCALGLDSLALPKVAFQKEDLDCIFNNKLVDNNAGFELTFELTNNNIESNSSRRSNTPKRGKSASPGRANLQTGGDFSRADSYENFDRAEDDRSLSLPIGNDQEKGGEANLATINGKESTTEIIGDSNQVIVPSHQHTPLTTDGADSGIGSDSPKAATTTILNGQNGNEEMLNGEYSMIVKNEQMIGNETKQRKMPPPVPPKVRRHSSVESVDDQQNQPNSQRPIIPSHSHHPHDQYEPLDPNDPLRGAIEDSTIGRDHSVLPPGARPNRRHSAHVNDANSGSSGDEANRAPPQRRVIISPMVQPELVASGRYDPNSRCFSYVPAKSLKAHYQAPKKPALKRRTSVVEPADLNVSPLEAKMALENFGLQGSSSDLRRRAETPKWDAEIDKVAGKIELDRRPRRASTSGTPVGHLQRDYVRSPSAQIRPQDEWRHRNQPKQQQQYRPIQSSPPHWNWPSAGAGDHRTTTFIPNGYIPSGRGGGGGSGWSTPINAHTMPKIVQSPRAENEFHPMASSMPAERPMVIEQAKRAAPSPVTHFSAQIRPGKRIPGVRPSPRRSEMDELCDPDFYFAYSTPTSSPVLGRKQQQMAQQKEDNRRMQAGELLSKSVPNDRAFKQIAQNELLRDDVRNLLAEHTMPIHFRSQTPQTTMLATNQRNKYLPSQGGINEEFRTRNCRSVNSTPLIGGRKLFVHNDSDEAATDPEGAEGWLHAKLAAVKNRRYMEPMAKNRREAEKMLLEELKSKAAKLVKGAGGGGDDPLEEYRREEQRLKNTQSPMVLDGLRQANRNLQKERAKQGYYGLNNSQQNPVPQPIAKSFPSGTQYQGPGQIRSLSATPGAGMIGNNPIGGIRSFHQNNPTPIAESPTPSMNIRRGATPTSQIVRGKPPTPPPTRIDRERSKSPYSSTKLLRGTSNSAPPYGKRMAEEEVDMVDGEGGSPSSAVNPNLLALRQSLYAKERERMGIKGGGGGMNIDDWVDENTNEFGEEKEKQRKWMTTPNRPQYLQQLMNSQLANSNPSTSYTFAYGGTNQNGSGTNRSTPVKPILKRTNANGGTNGGNESPLLMQRKTLPMNLAPHQQNDQTLNEESSFGHPISGSNPNSSNPASTNWLVERSDTPQFPILPERETPLPYHPLLYRTAAEDHPQQGAITTMPPTAKIGGNSATLPFASVGPNNGGINNNINNNNSTRFGAMTPHSIYGGGHGPASGFSRRSSLTSIDAGEVIHHHPIFVKDTSRFWYKPTISREEAINMLKNKPPGTFVVRDSNSFPGAFGLALKVSQPPAGVTPTDGSELVRHFLIEPSTKGVRLKGCSNEPVFGTLAALVYQHSITPLALPCRLILPEYDPASSPEHINSNQALLERGAACNVTYLCSVDTESLTGPEAVRRSAAFAFEMLHRRELRAVPVHFKVSSQGITLTDNTRSLFFRRHYPVNSVTFAGIDPESRVFDNNNVAQLPPTYVRQAPIFGYVARKLPTNGFNGSVENACHIFAELDPDQPASAVVRFITNVMMPAGRSQLQQIHQNANIH